ncbi:hypothetical protein BOO71_0009973 [Deinococcus marmoris]|uniref:Uncharacterized protein n=1 Tax=Deinococcus marmoris TaxID=249408 RepID=A0A1U7NVU4_9DEIO|nr:hypothetical protein BOO71_0009973 [Deinococcus marmoris]
MQWWVDRPTAAGGHQSRRQFGRWSRVLTHDRRDQHRWPRGGWARGGGSLPGIGRTGTGRFRGRIVGIHCHSLYVTQHRGMNHTSAHINSR